MPVTVKINMVGKNLKQTRFNSNSVEFAQPDPVVNKRPNGLFSLSVNKGGGHVGS